MDHLGFLANEQDAALVVFAFLQTDCIDLNYSKELFSKAKDLIATRDINHNGHRIDTEDNGDLETDGHLESDGHLPGSFTVCLEDILPLVQLQRPGDQEEALNIQAVAQGLREIASQLELEAVARATQNLSRNISESPSRLRNHLVNEVDRLMREGVCLKDLPRERVFVALTLTLVKGVCIQAPQLLRSLFDTAVQFICHGWAR